MSRDPVPGAEPEEDQGQEQPGPGRVRPTSVASLIGFAAVGLVVGWLVHPLSIRMNGTAPTVTWLPVLALALVAIVMLVVAWTTQRSLAGHGDPLAPHQAVNRLVLGKACALVGALVGGGYAGYALSWLSALDADLAKQRALHSAAAALCCLVIVVGSLLVERACRVRDTDK